MLKLLYISAFVPYDKIRHGGGQTFNYYVNEILKENNIETTMVGFCRHEDKNFLIKMKWDSYVIQSQLEGHF